MEIRFIIYFLTKYEILNVSFDSRQKYRRGAAPFRNLNVAKRNDTHRYLSQQLSTHTHMEKKKKRL